jgi:DNA polymerase III epsilon subunit-like protein
MKILVFDTETTNLFPKLPLLEETLDKWPFIVQFSFLLMDTDTNKYDEYDYVIQTSTIIENHHIHGITNSMNKVRGFCFEDIYPIFDVCVQKADLVIGHNIKFDLTMLQVECMRKKIPFSISKPTYCTMMSSTRLCNLPNYKWPKLEELHRHLFQEDAKNLHNSMIDVIVCLRCYLWMMQRIDICKVIKKLKIF